MDNIGFTAILMLLILFSIFIIARYLKIKKVIYIYGDDGTSKIALMHTLFTLRKALDDKYDIKIIKAKEIIEGNWIKDTILLVVPGGADLLYVQKLNGDGNKSIKNFIQNGGSYLGICAGSYYGSSYVEFDKSGELEILGKRELSFFPGKAIGPVLAPYDYQSNSGARGAVIEVNGHEINLYFNGGCYFENAKNYPHVSVLCNYKNERKLAAIIHIKYGQGHVILSGIHFEFDPFLLNENDHHLSKITSALKKDDSARQDLVKEILNKLTIR